MNHLPKKFKEIAEAIIAEEKERTSDWRLTEKEGCVELDIPKLSEKGFDVSAVADEREVSVYTEYIAHDHFSSEDNHEECSYQALGLVRDLLTPKMRIKVFEVGGKDYRADMEIQHDGSWRRASTTALFAFTLFRKKTIKYFSNERLSERKIA